MKSYELGDVLAPLNCCGSPDIIFEKLQELLTVLHGRTFYRENDIEAHNRNWKDSWKKLVLLLGPQDQADYWLWLHVIDHLGLTEHGGGIAGSWLTRKGEEVLQALRKFGADPEMWARDELDEDRMRGL